MVYVWPEGCNAPPPALHLYEGRPQTFSVLGERDLYLQGDV